MKIINSVFSSQNNNSYVTDDTAFLRLLHIYAFLQDQRVARSTYELSTQVSDGEESDCEKSYIHKCDSCKQLTLYSNKPSGAYKLGHCLSVACLRKLLI